MPRRLKPRTANLAHPPPPSSTAAVVETGAKLVDAIADAEKKDEHDERQAQRQRSRRVLFEEANAPKNAGVPPGIASVVSKVFLHDSELAAAYDFIHENLALGEKLTQHGYLVGALDRAETVHRLAHRLYVSAKVERSAWERDNAKNFAALRQDAQRLLQKEKDEGKRSKQITDSDVESTCAWLFPDEWREQEAQRDRLKAAEDSLGNLVEVCSSRCRTLQALLTKHR